MTTTTVTMMTPVETTPTTTGRILTRGALFEKTNSYFAHSYADM